MDRIGDITFGKAMLVFYMSAILWVPALLWKWHLIEKEQEETFQKRLMASSLNHTKNRNKW